MKKQLTSYMILFFFSLCFSCEKESLYNNSDNETDKELLIPFAVQLDPFSSVETKAYEYETKNVNILVFKNGNLFSSFYTSTILGRTRVIIQNISVPSSYPYTVYGVANTGDFNRFDNITTESQFLSELYTVTNLDEITPNSLLIYSGSLIISTYQSNILLPLTSVCAKLLVTVNNNTPALELIGMRFGNIANRSYYISKGATDAATGALTYYNSDWAPITSGAQQPFYIFENQKGIGVNKTTSKAAPPGASYIEILAKKLDTGDRYIYRIYLGENNTTDYNVKRNYEYTIAININGVSQIATDIRVTKYSTIGYIQNGLFLHYDGIWNGGAGVSVGNSNTTSRGTWVNLGTGGSYYNLTLSNFGYTSLDGWNIDCLIFPSNRTRFASSITLKDTDRPATGTLEVVFRGGPTPQGTGYAMAAITQAVNAQPYTVFESEYYSNGLGFGAATNWNGKDYTNSNIQTSKWHTAVQFDGNKCIGYFNGTQVFQEIKTYPSLPYNATSCFIIGNYSPSATTYPGFSGRIYAIRFYNRVLTAQEIQANYQIDKLRFGLN